jgi:hypothetical protein
MTNKDEDSSISLVDAYLRSFRLARASDLAMSHRFLEAEGLICEKGLTNLDSDHLDLLARIYVRQNRFLEARDAWKRASATNSDRAKYSLLLNDLASFEVVVAKRKRLVFITAIALVILFILILCLTYGRPVK